MSFPLNSVSISLRNSQITALQFEHLQVSLYLSINLLNATQAAYDGCAVRAHPLNVGVLVSVSCSSAVGTFAFLLFLDF